MTILSNISFMEVALTLTFLGVFERLVMPYLPEEMVGPDGWLLKTSD